MLGGLAISPSSHLVGFNQNESGEPETHPSDVAPLTRFGTRKVAALLAYLACHLNRSHPRELLVEVLWPEEDPTATRVRLRTVLANLRQILEPGGTAPGSVLIADRMSIQLNPAAVDTDVASFDLSLQRVKAAGTTQVRMASLHQAVAIYQGELLPGYYEEWVLTERERVADAYLGALAEYSDLLAEAGDTETAIGQARKAVTADPLRESSHRRLMRLYDRTERRPDALRQYRDLERILKVELNSGPGEETRALAREIEVGGSHRPRPLEYASFKSRGVEPTRRLPTNLVPHSPEPSLEPDGGAVPLDSPFYIGRRVDAAFQQAVLRRDSIVLLKGPRQVGKTSLLARGMQRARESGAAVALTDFQKITAEQLQSTDTLFRALAERIIEDLELDVSLKDLWEPERGWSLNFERFLRREVLLKIEAPLVWGLDEVDRLFAYPYAGEVFGLFRSWHNERALQPSAPWRRFTLAIAYATEAHLFITDLNQSPFNVGTRLELEDFTGEQVTELNRRYGSPLKTASEIARFTALVGGHPYLARCGLRRMSGEGMSLAELEESAPLERGPFGDHLRRLAQSLSRDLELRDALRHALDKGCCPTEESFYRLRSAGVLLGDTATAVRPRCHLYRRYLETHLA